MKAIIARYQNVFLSVSFSIFALFCFSHIVVAQDQAQQEEVTGVVIDAQDGTTLPGVNIVLKGTTIGVATDSEGAFSLQVPSLSDTLIFSYLGYQTQVVPLEGRSELTVNLESMTIVGDEMVVVGYGTTTEREVTGSISSLNEDDFKKGNISQPIDLLQGEVAGLQVVNAGGGDPNGEKQFQLRGLTTLSGSREPLIVVDGVPNADMQSLDPDEIQNISVLKGGSAAAIYGTRGTNGVLLITTKTPQEGDLLLEFSSRFTTEVVSKEIENLSASQYRELIKEKYPNNWEAYDQGSSTDWFNEITRQPFSQDYNFAISGGVTDMSYRAALNFTSNQGIVRKNSNDQIQAKVFVNQEYFDNRLDVDYRLRYNMINRDMTDTWIMQQAFRYNPTAPVYDETNEEAGGYYRNPNPFQYFNPVALVNEEKDDNQEEAFNGSVNARFKLLDNLDFSVQGALVRSTIEGGMYQSRYYPIALGTNGTAEKQSIINGEEFIEPRLNYETSIGNNNIEALAGYSYQNTSSEEIWIQNSNFDTDFFQEDNMGVGYSLGEGTASMYTHKETSKLASFFGRVKYNYDQKYLFTASLRYEGSSRFGADNKWGAFPAISGGWRINQESFMSDIDWLDNLKLRAGYGVTGNQGIGNYQSLALLQTGGRMYYNGQWVNTYEPASNPNPDLKWETKTEVNIGVDFDVLGGRVSGNVDYYDRTTSDLLYTYDVPVPPNVYGTTFANVGEMNNKGFELTLSFIPVQKRDFQWNSTVLYSRNRNKLVSFSSPSEGYELSELKTGWFYTDITAWTQKIVEGGAIGNFVAPVFDGLTEDGTQAIHKDFNGDGFVGEEDRRVVGNAYPDFRISFKNTINYKKWDFSFLLRGVFGHSILNAHRMYYENFSYLGQKNILASALDYPNFQGSVDYSSRFVEDASFVKLDNLSIGYNIGAIGDIFRSARIFVSGQQLLTITNYSGVDPEIDIGGLEPGIDRYSYYPRTRRFTVGLNIDF